MHLGLIEPACISGLNSAINFVSGAQKAYSFISDMFAKPVTFHYPLHLIGLRPDRGETPSLPG